MVRLENVGLRYGHGPEILRDVSFHLEAGGFSFLTGPSGAGKTSLLRMLFLALKPTRGLIRLFGEDVTMIDRAALPFTRRRIGVVFQEFRLLDHLTTYDNVALPLRVAGQRESSYRADVMDLLSWVGLADQAQAYPPVLSGGEKQRAAIARAVIGKPELLLADEPTGNVDPALARRLLHLFVELNRLGTTVLIATHDLKLVQQAKAPILHLERGELRAA
ncbi:cell division ATP-binding protein FtsE [Aestuariivirga sp.]|uniref:cell division ATP-binding protein FtsE n=1 Tax=Aestuariivirga sp. TaxID=2650926 RepID=UPI0039E56269